MRKNEQISSQAWNQRPETLKLNDHIKVGGKKRKPLPLKYFLKQKSQEHNLLCK